MHSSLRKPLPYVIEKLVDIKTQNWVTPQYLWFARKAKNDVDVGAGVPDFNEGLGGLKNISVCKQGEAPNAVPSITRQKYESRWRS